MSDLPPPPPEPPPPPPPGFTPSAPPPPGYQAYGATSATPTYASFGARLGALVIDGIVMFVFFVPALIAIFAGPTEIEACSVDEAGDITIGGDLNALCEVPTGATWAMFAVLMLVGVAAVLLYHAKLTGGPSGATVGKKAVGIKVVDASTGGPIGGGRAVGRYLFASFISGNVFLLGYLWSLWDKRNQTWHDKVVSSVVVKA